jgi:hypothetical protein
MQFALENVVLASQRKRLYGVNKMVLTLNDILNISPILHKLSKQTFQGKTVFQIARLIKLVDEELNTLDTARQKIIDKYGEKDEKGQLIVSENGQVHVSPANTDSCNQEFYELLSTEVNIDASPLSLSCFDSVELTPNEALLLGKIVED